jgi:hypothetical protein
VVTIIEERLAALEELTLDRGAHEPDGQFCVMEAAAWIAGEPWSDAPKCVSPVISEFLRSWNDSLDDDDRQMLKPLIPKVIGTTRNKRDEERRAWMCIDWLARECAPAFLRLAGLMEDAETLEGLAPLANKRSAEKAQPKLDSARAAARDAAWSAVGDADWEAARAAARDAAQDSARAAAWHAAQDTAQVAAWSAVEDAAWHAAWYAARAAVGAALEPTVKTLQASAVLLVERMAEVGR